MTRESEAKGRAMKNTLLLCTGVSGAGKNYFIKNHLPRNLFHMLAVATTRPPRPGECEGIDRYFVDEDYFYAEKFATWSWVNEFDWQPGNKKWMYGIPEFEIKNNLGKNLAYDVIEPKYAKQLIDWFRARKLTRDYDIKTAYFLPPKNNFEIAKKRANMKNDDIVRRNNTCDPIDFLRAGIHPDWFAKSSKEEVIFDPRMTKYFATLEKAIMKRG
jgi:guanylate kinase